MKELFDALAKAQAEMSNPQFDSVNPHFRSKFASLASVRNAVIPILAKHGVFVTQELTTTERGIACSTIFMKGGEMFKFEPLVMPASKADAQGFGSAATYARRYSLMAACGVVGDEDDDGNAASKNPKQIAPADGAFESLDDEEKLAAQTAASIVTDMFTRQSADKAADLWEEKSKPFGGEAKVAAWKLIPSNVRSAIKSVQAKRKEPTTYTPAHDEGAK